MWHGRCDPVAYAVWRLFAWEPGQELPRERLHFQPIPVLIPRQRWVATTVRIQHWGAADGERWQARQRKYTEASGRGRRVATDFGGLDSPGSADWPEWEPRPPPDAGQSRCYRTAGVSGDTLAILREETTNVAS